MNIPAPPPGSVPPLPGYMPSPGPVPPYGHLPPPPRTPPRAPLRPHGAWYAAPGVLLLVALGLAALGALAGMTLTAGKWFACDATTSCAYTPYEPGYRDPAWPQLPFTAATAFAAAAVVSFAVILLLRWRGAARRASRLLAPCAISR
ncbi:hypothetical protein ACWFQ8_32160 [Streptomyces sp. NPDC055254]